MIFPALSDLFFGFVPSGISDDLHTDAIIETANDFLKLLSKIAPDSISAGTLSILLRAPDCV